MNPQRHLSQAKSNENAARSIEALYPDWTVTMCFYSTLHLVEYHAAQKGVNILEKFAGVSPHDSRRSYVYVIAKELGSKRLQMLYDNLESASKKARYLEKIKYGNAIDFFKSDKSKVEEAFQQLQQIKDILTIS